jgi:hypothetical protein
MIGSWKHGLEENVQTIERMAEFYNRRGNFLLATLLAATALQMREYQQKQESYQCPMA